MSIVHDIPRDLKSSAALRRATNRIAALEAELAEREAFTLRLAERLFLAAEVLGRLAERKDRR